MPDYSVSHCMAKGLGRGEGFSWPGDLLALLLEEGDPRGFFPLQVLNSNCVRRHPGSPDALVCDLHQSDGDPTLVVSARPRVGLPPICCEAAGYPFQGSFHLYTQWTIDTGN